LSRFSPGRTRLSLAGRVVVVTGGARGIGLATARLLAGERASVAIADIDPDAAAATARELGSARAYRLDVSDRAAFGETLASVEADMGPVDALVNNAAVMALGPFADLDEHIVTRHVEVNLLGVVNGMQLALPEMLRRRSGHLINVASAAGRWGVPGESIYGATKHAVVGLSEAVRGELRGLGVEISVVLFGPVRDTELASGMRSTRAIRTLAPETVAAAIVAALRQPRFEVWIPRRLGWLEASGHLLPRPLRERAQRAFGLAKIGTSIDGAARASYEGRTFGESPITREFSTAQADAD
jgi:NADP-dependent 3-hydroxy acid dehydrogenase YdfG